MGGAKLTDLAIGILSTDAATVGQLGGAGSFLAVIAASGDVTGATDTAALQAALTSARTGTGGLVKGLPGGVFYISAQLVIGSATTLDMSDCTVNLVSGSVGGLIRNYAAVNAAATAADAATTATSNVITTSLGASAVVGQSVVVAGAAGPASPNSAPLCGLVSAQTGTTITITNLDGSPLAAANTVTSAAVSLYTRDKNITLRGGYWKAATSGNGNATGHKIMFAHLDHYTIDTQGVSTTTGVGYLHLLADGTDGYVNARNLSSTTTGQDGVHVQGPHYGLVVGEITGKIGDDGLSLTASDYPSPTVTSGNIIGVHVNTVDVTTIERTMIVIAGSGNLVDDVVVSGGLRGTASYIHIGDDVNHAQTEGGTYGSIDLGNVAVKAGSSAVGLYSPSASRIRVSLDYANSAIAPQFGVETFSGAAAQTIAHLEVNGYFASGSSRAIYHNSANVVLDHVVLTGLNFVNADNGSSAMVWLQGSVAITTLDIIGCRWSSSGFGGYMVLVNSAGGSIGQVNITGGEMLKGHSVIGDNSGVSLVATFSGGFTANSGMVAEMSATSGGTKTYVLAGCQFQGGMNPAVTVNTAAATFLGDLLTTTSGSFKLLTRAGSETVRVLGPLLQVDLSQLSRSGVGDMAYNSNGALACGTGPCISSGSGSAGSWKNLSSGATY
jgi:hypothetical protein